ncbi:MAG: leucyl aminopeptidase [Candidatus Hydrogenedentes bacterium]|nr:leucyl aminopeptidase [Candidatus Hydrogenedentota bacterium]
MNVNIIRAADLKFVEAETCLIVPMYQGVLPLTSEALRSEDEFIFQTLADRDVLKGKKEEVYYLPTPGAPYRGAMVLGLGPTDKFDAEVLRRGAGKACNQLKANRVQHVYLDISHFSGLPVEAFVEGIILGSYDFDVYKERPEDQPEPVKVAAITVITSKDADHDGVREACEQAARTCLSVNGARHLANTPPNEMTPAALAEFAHGIAEDAGCECVVLEEKQMASLGMNALLGVSSGSSEPPRLIILRYHHSDDARTLAIVGKGVTFDSGGISIKPAAGMHEMKFDMCGAAAVLCTMLNVTAIKPKVNVVCVVPAVENMTGPAAQVPGDIVRAYNGKTIEVHNTDAEGRLILADAMAYTVDKYKPDYMVDLATLTGACVIALGHYAAGLFDNSEDLRQQLVAAAEVSGERVWPMPLDADYEKLIEGTHADVCNIGPRGEAGAVTAAAFLKQFVGETPWAHLDIAGTAWGGKNISYLDPNHATGYGVRLLTAWILGSGGQ